MNLGFSSAQQNCFKSKGIDSVFVKSIMEIVVQRCFAGKFCKSIVCIKRTINWSTEAFSEKQMVELLILEYKSCFSLLIFLSSFEKRQVMAAFNFKDTLLEDYPITLPELNSQCNCHNKNRTFFFWTSPPNLTTMLNTNFRHKNWKYYFYFISQTVTQQTEKKKSDWRYFASAKSKWASEALYQASAASKSLFSP